MLKSKRLLIKVYAYVNSLSKLIVGIKNLYISRYRIFQKLHLRNVKYVEGDFLRVAIVALYPAKNNLYLKSLENLLLGLAENEVHAFLVINSDKIDSEIQRIVDLYKCSVILRKNFGRDFGAYQCGVLALIRSERLEKLDRLYLINDTLIWRANPTMIIQETSREKFQSIWLNLEQNVHAHSFYLSFSNEVITNPKFLKFWSKYIPSNSRNHAIHKGENQLTNVLLQVHFICQPLVTPKFLEDKLSRVFQLNPNKFLFAKTLRIGNLWPANPPLADVKRPLEIDLHKTIDEKEWIRVVSAYSYSDAPHRLALITELFEELPLKKDLFKFFGLQEISEVLNFTSHPYRVDAITYYLNRSQNHQASNMRIKLLRSTGEI